MRFETFSCCGNFLSRSLLCYISLIFPRLSHYRRFMFKRVSSYSTFPFLSLSGYVFVFCICLMLHCIPWRSCVRASYSSLFVHLSSPLLVNLGHPLVIHLGGPAFVHLGGPTLGLIWGGGDTFPSHMRSQEHEIATHHGGLHCMAGQPQKSIHFEFQHLFLIVFVSLEMLRDGKGGPSTCIHVPFLTLCLGWDINPWVTSYFPRTPP